jgi:hypothetical protein
MLAFDVVVRDFQFSGQPNAYIDFIHRGMDGAEIYYVANRINRWEKNVNCTFRVNGKVPEIWDPVTGSVRPASAYSQKEGTTSLPLEFAPYGSMFIVFRDAGTAGTAGKADGNFPVFSAPSEIGGAWEVRFDPKWGGPESVTFNQLESWTARTEEGIRYYSGTAMYTKEFDVPESLWKPGTKLLLDLGDVRNVCEVRLNGQSLGTLWTEPFRIEVTGAIKSTGNKLEVDVTNLWPNRLIGDWNLPVEKRFTKTNVNHILRDKKAKDSLLISGLLGPVRIMTPVPDVVK